MLEVGNYKAKYIIEIEYVNNAKAELFDIIEIIINFKSVKGLNRLEKYKSSGAYG